MVATILLLIHILRTEVIQAMEVTLAMEDTQAMEAMVDTQDTVAIQDTGVTQDTVDTHITNLDKSAATLLLHLLDHMEDLKPKLDRLVKYIMVRLFVAEALGL